MSVRFLAALAAGLLLAALTPARAQDRVAPPKVKPTAEAVLKALHESEVIIEGDLSTIPLFELTQYLSKRHGVGFVINEENFRAENVNDIKEKRPNLAAPQQLNGLTLHQLLSHVLESMNATYVIRNGGIEVVTVRYAARLSKAEVVTGGGEGGARTALAEPLVSVIVKEKPLNEVLAELAERYDLNVTLAPQAGDARTGFVTARLLNVPADRAVEYLALLADLRVVRQGNTFLVTGRDHVNELFHEKLDREREKIEVEKLRNAPPPKPEPQPDPKP
jgi:hypothetical protein